MTSRIDQLYTFYKLKTVERRGTLEGVRPESTADHVYSCMVLAKYFIPLIEQKVDVLKVYDMIVAHDLIEIYAGDSFFLDEQSWESKEEHEDEAAKRLRTDLPESVADQYMDLWEEFVARESIESQFVKALSELDPILQSIHRPIEWTSNGFTEEILRKKKERWLKPFPAMIELFEELVIHLKKNKSL